MKKIMVIVALAVLVACGGNKPVSSGSTTSTTSAAGDAFKDLGVKGLNAKAKITYTLTGSDGKTTTVTVAQDPPKRSFKSVDSDGNETLLISSDNGDYIACSGDSCYTIPGLGNVAGAAGAAFLGPLAQGFDVFKNLQGVPGYKDLGSRTIAGRTATCASWTPPFATSGYTQCLDTQTGLALYFEYSDPSGATKVEATQFGEPAASDFTPTHPVQSIPTSFPTTVPSYPTGSYSG